MTSQAQSLGNVKNGLIVSVGDVALGTAPLNSISTYGLGSCVAVVIYSGSEKIGGILHAMLPESVISKDRAERQPAAFMDTGLGILSNLLRQSSYSMHQMQVALVGGASVLGGVDMFQIGKRNIAAAENIFEDNKLNIRHKVVGGFDNRSLHLFLNDGSVQVKTPKEILNFSMK